MPPRPAARGLNRRDIVCSYEGCGAVIGALRGASAERLPALAPGYEQSLAGVWQWRRGSSRRRIYPVPKDGDRVRCAACEQALTWDRALLLAPEQGR